MEVYVFDVEHGFCAAVVSPTRKLLMVDCGHNAATRWRPSGWISYHGLTVDHLTISNIDEDHVSDLAALREHVLSFTTNWHISGQWIRRAKSTFGMGPGVAALVEMMDASPGPAASIDWGMDVEHFCHPPSLFDDENSLSVVTFVRYAGVRIVFPGDLTRKAWLAFLDDASFVWSLSQTNIFIASHHGRDSGYCPEVFRHCTPDVIVVSDKPICYETQNVDYGRHATGIVWNTTERRRVLTTRQDGSLTVTPSNGGFYIKAHG